MREEKRKITSQVDGLELELLVVEPEEVRAVVQISHGMCEHKERYLEFMRFLADHGVASIIHDHRGHGASVKSLNDLGYMYGQGAKGLVEDLRQITRYARKCWTGVPLILLGHSMGSLTVRVYAKQYDSGIDGLIVCGSPSRNRDCFRAEALSGRPPQMQVFGDDFLRPLRGKIPKGEEPFCVGMFRPGCGAQIRGIHPVRLYVHG